MDEFEIHDIRMIGYLPSNSPIKADNDCVLITAYVKNQKTMIALANWLAKKVDPKLKINWRSLGLTENSSNIAASAIKDFQPAAEFKDGESISVESGKGWLITISSK